MAPKVFVLSCDGAPLFLVERWAREGHLPAFASLLEGGAKGDLESVYPPITGPAWTSFMTGRNPGKHGVADWYVRSQGSYKLRPVDSTSIGVSTIWDEAREGGKRIISLGLPMNYPPPKVNGIVVSGLETPGTQCATFPPEVGERITKAIPTFRTHLQEVYRPGGEKRAIDDLLEITDIQSDVALHMLDTEEDWDLLLLHHQSSDWAMHFFWHAMDPEHPRYSDASNAAAGNAILDVFRRIDDGLGRILSKLPEDTTVLVVSDHGFGVLDKYLYLNNWLLELGLLKLKVDAKTQITRAMFKMGFTPSNVYRLAEKLGLNKFAFRMDKTSRVNILSKMFLSSDDIDWPATQAYSVGNIGQVYVNLKGREPQGRVAQGREYEEVRDRIIASALELTDPDTGEKVIEKAQRKEEVYSGPFTHDLPDVLLVPQGFRYQAGGLTQFMSNRLMEPSFAYTGGHRMNGILLLSGPGVEPGEVDGARLIDIAPSILHLLGLAVPADMDGVVLPQLRGDEASVATRPDAAAATDSASDGYSEEEEREVAERLRSLGYVE